MAGTLLVPHQDVLDLALLENLVIDRQHRAAGIAEDVLDAMIGQRAHDHRGAGHLVGIVALVVVHGWLRMRPLARLGRLSFLENKKGPERPHAHRPFSGWPQPAPAVRLGTTRIRTLMRVWVILLLILALRLLKGCAEHSGQTRKVKAGGHRRYREINRVWWIGR